MSQIHTLGLYQPGSSILHRITAGWKLLALVALGVASVWLGHRWWLTVATLAVVIGLYFLAGLSARLVWRQIRPMLWLLIFTYAMHWWVNGLARATCVTGMIVALVLAAALVTLTTPTTQLVDGVVIVLNPFRRFGVDPHRVSLVLLLGIRCVPVVAGIGYEVREAQIARSATTSMRAFAVPLIVRAIRDAENIGDALVARGFDEE